MRENVELCVGLFGAPGADRNLGVGALRESSVAGLLQRRPDAGLTVFDDGWGIRTGQIRVDGVVRSYQLCGVRHSRRVHQQESFAHMRLAGLLGLPNRGLGVVDRSTAIWDLSGGDSFSDIYGRRRFRTVTLPKRLALARHRRLILMPQTYGPFQDPALREQAKRLVACAHAVWARDVDSYAALEELLGAEFDAHRHRLGVDLAFELPPQTPDNATADCLRQIILSAEGGPVVGFNVSGLLLNDLGADSRYGLRINYRELVDSLAINLLSRGAVLVLVPHVLGTGQRDSDEDVTYALADRLKATYPDRVLVAPRELGAGGRKWLISQLDWFCGTRMHSTIAGLSSGVPTAAIAYSLKVRGVFASCGQESQVADGRSSTTGDALDLLIESFERRDRLRSDLALKLPSVLDRARSQMDCIVERSHPERDPGGD